MRKGKATEQILSVLADGEEYGLGIIQNLKARDSKPPSLGGLYVILHRLEKAGIVTARWGETMPERNGARRRYYQLKDK